RERGDARPVRWSRRTRWPLPPGRERSITMRSIVLPLAAIAAFVPAIAGAAEFTLSSKALVDGVAPAQVSNAFGCTGGNVSPDLAWSGAPAGTKAFTLTLYDPDAPTG